MEAWLRNLAEWLKRHPRTFAIGSVIVLIPAGLATLEGIWSLFSDEPLFPYIAERFPWWAFIIFGFIFVFCIVLIVKVYSLIKKPPQIEIEKKNLTDTLTAMHRRLIELQKDKASHTNVSREELKKVLPTLAARVGVIELEDWPEFEREIGAKVGQATPPKPRMTLRGKFNFKRWQKLNEQWKEQVYFSASSVITKAMDELFHTKEWTLADCIKVSNWLDGYDWGIKEVRDNDLQWKPLYESIDNRFRIDDTLGALIKEHIDLSYVYNSSCLIIYYSGKFKGDIYSLILYEALMGSPMSPEQADIDLSKVLGKIEKRLQEMANE